MSRSSRISLIHNQTGQTKIVMLKFNGDQMFKQLMKIAKNKFNSRPKQLYLLPSGTKLSRENINALEHVTHAEILVTKGEPPNINEISKHTRLEVRRNQKIANAVAKRAKRREALNPCIESKGTLQGQDMDKYQIVVLQTLMTAMSDWHLTIESNLLGIIIEYADFEPTFEVFDRGLLISPDFLQVALRPSRKARKRCKGTMTSRLNGFLFAGKHAVMFEIPRLGEGSTVSIGVVGRIFDPLRRVGVGFGKDSWGYCSDGVFRHAGEWIIHHRNKRRKSSHSKYRRTGKSLKAGDKMVVYVSLCEGGVKNFIVYLNGTKYCWPQVIKHLPYPLAFAVSINHVDDKVRILPQGLTKWFNDFVSSRSDNTFVDQLQDEIVATEGAVTPLESDEVLPLDETVGTDVVPLDEDSS